MKECIRFEALSGPIILTSITLIRAGLTLMILTGTYLLIGRVFRRINLCNVLSYRF